MLWLIPLISKEVWAVLFENEEITICFWSFLKRMGDTENPAIDFVTPF